MHNGSRQKSLFFFQTLKDPAFSIFNNLLWRRARQHLIISLSFYSAFSPVDDHYSSPSIPGICIPIVESTIQEDSIGDRVVEIMILTYCTALYFRDAWEVGFTREAGGDFFPFVWDFGFSSVASVAFFLPLDGRCFLETPCVQKWRCDG